MPSSSGIELPEALNPGSSTINRSLATSAQDALTVILSPEPTVVATRGLTQCIEDASNTPTGGDDAALTDVCAVAAPSTETRKRSSFSSKGVAGRCRPVMLNSMGRRAANASPSVTLTTWAVASQLPEWPCDAEKVPDFQKPRRKKPGK